MNSGIQAKFFHQSGGSVALNTPPFKSGPDSQIGNQTPSTGYGHPSSQREEGAGKRGLECDQKLSIGACQSSGAVRKSRWPSWALSP